MIHQILTNIIERELKYLTYWLNTKDKENLTDVEMSDFKLMESLNITEKESGKNSILSIHHIL